MNRKSKALPGAFPNDGTATIDQAYDELTRSAFAVWIRLMTERPETLKMGKAKLAALLGYSPRRSDEVLTELARKGYISVIKTRPRGEPAAIGPRGCEALRRAASVGLGWLAGSISPGEAA